MYKIIYNQNIALSSADAIVNAANGQGYMGGKRGVTKQQKGVAESLQFYSRGSAEILAKKEAKKHIFGFAPGSVFVTDALNLNTKHIIHAVTMRYPGSYAKLKTIDKLLPKIELTAQSLNIKTVAIPLLGTGTGHLHKIDVLNLYDLTLSKSNIEYWIYIKE